MKKLLLTFLVFPVLFSCMEGDKKTQDDKDPRIEDRERVTDTSSQGEDGDIVDESATEKDGVQTQEVEEEPEIKDAPTSAGLEGNYIRIDPPESLDGCNCYCLEISFATPTELCVSPDDIYISARFSRNGNNKANVFFEEVLRSTDTETEIPWGDFDKTTPIATVSLQPDGSMKLDWLGFAIDGEIAVDYAIYGKKSLEGIFKRK